MVQHAHIQDRLFSKYRRVRASPSVAFVVLAAVQVTLIAAITVVVVALPRLRRSLGLDEGQAILVSSGYGLSFGGLLLLGSRLGERYGLRRCLAAGLWVFVIGSVLGGLADDWPLLIAARLVQGTGAALAAPAAMGLLPAVALAMALLSRRADTRDVTLPRRLRRPAPGAPTTDPKENP